MKKKGQPCANRRESWAQALHPCRMLRKMIDMHQLEKILLKGLLQGKLLPALAQEQRLSPDALHKAAFWLREKGLVKIEEKEHSIIQLTPEGEGYKKDGFPELLVAQKASAGSAIASLTLPEKSIGLGWAKKNNWVSIETGGKLSLTPAGKEALAKNDLASSLAAIAAGKKIPDPLLAQFLSRNLLREKKEKEISVSLTPSGRQEAAKLPERIAPEANVLTKEMLLSGEWGEVSLRPYNVEAESETIYPGKRHPLSLLAIRIRDIFSEMGFQEMEGGPVESSFWNFDALFQPQDHPARDLADTFYLKGSLPLPKDEKLVSRVKEAHEQGWHYSWSAQEAQRPVLRTHTTPLSARYLYSSCQEKNVPQKFFALGKVFRNEATDYKHLAEFQQVEGIVVWEDATFSDLLGFLTEFYRKLGFEKIKFVPHYFPYTEPSLEIYAYFPSLGEWVEMGGAGIFRPEVSLPLCNRYPVLAWGLSLERLPMILENIGDIRTFYRNNLGWLRKEK